MLAPILGGIIGGGIDIASTRIIGYNAYSIFLKGELPSAEEFEDSLIKESGFEEIDDIDVKMIENVIK